MNWQPMETAPKGKPILALCKHDADPYYEPKSARLTVYGGHTEGMSHVCDGPHVVVWGGAHTFTEDEGGGHMPDWWFQFGTDFEVTANPIGWSPIPETMP